MSKSPAVVLDFKIVFSITVLYAFSGNAYAQKLILKDEITHEPISMANVFCSDNKVSTATDINGEADIADFGSCDSIYIKFIGYSSVLISYDSLKQKDFRIYLKQDPITLNETTVSATRWEQSKRNIPNKIVSIKARDVMIGNPQTAADMLGETGEVFIQKSQLGGGSPVIRGFAANRVLISVDGIRMNNAIFRSGNLQNVISLDPFAIDNAEVIFGPGSIIYGSDAIGGVMSFYTLNPDVVSNEPSHFNAHVVARYSSADNEMTGHFDMIYGMKKWGFVTSVTYSGYDDMKMGKFGPDDYLRNRYVVRRNNTDLIVQNVDPQLQIPSGYHQLNLLQKISYKINKDWTLNYGFHYSATGNYPRYDRLLQTKENLLKYAEWYYGPQVWMMNHFHVSGSSNMAVYDKIIIHAAWQNFKESRHKRKLNDDSRNNRNETVDVLNLNLDLEKIIDSRNRLVYGVEYIFNIVGSKANDLDIKTSGISPAAPRYPDGSTWNSIALYADYFHKITPKTNLRAGARYSYIVLNADFDKSFYDFPFDNAHINTGAPTASLGIINNPDESIQLMANVSTGFRAPNIDDVGKIFDSEPGSVVVPNPDLRSEYSLNNEVGISKIFSKKFKFDISAYYTILFNAMVRHDFLFNGQDSIIYDGEMSRVQAVQNASKANVYGVQAGIEWKLPLNLTFSSRFNYMKGTEDAEDGGTVPMRHSTPVFGAIHIIYSRNHLEVDLYAVYNGTVPYSQMPPSEISKDYMYAKDTDGNPYTPDWYTINLKSLYRVSDNFILTLGIENFTNQRYRPFSSGISSAGINVIASVKISF